MVYGMLLIPFVAMLVLDPGGDRGRALVVVTVLVAIATCDYLASQTLWSRAAAILDMGIGLTLVALVVSGPVAAFVVAAVPDLVRLAQRRKAFWGVGLLANVVSYAALVLAGAGVLALDSAHGVAGHVLALLLAGLVMAAVGYTFARLPLAVVRERHRPLSLIRREFVAALPLELGVIVAGVTTCLLLPSFGVATLVVFASLAWVPQIAVAVLVRAPSVAALSVDAAAAVYRGAIADELRLPRSDRRLIEQVAALAECQPLPGALPAPPGPLIRDALLVRLCSTTSPTQRAFSALPRTQVVLVAREWALLTARCTRALNHHEALLTLADGPLALDAPQALSAVARIIERERAFTQHTAAAPRLHRAPLPGRVRRQLLPRVLNRLASS